MGKWDKVDKAYEFLLKKEGQVTSFTVKEIANATSWKDASVKTYLAKRWHDFVERTDKAKYKANGVSKLSKEEFRDLHSQKLTKKLLLVNKIPKTNREVSLYKSREFAILAVSIYNNPTITFKTYGYIVNMVIAWTALFHAIFEKNGTDYFHKDKQGHYKQIDGEKKAFELAQCCKSYWKGDVNPVNANLEFLVGLRNKIEHRSLPELDFIVAGECQACLTNFENLLVQEFGDEYSLNANLAISMQLSQVSQKSQQRALKEFQSKNYEVIRQYIKDFQEGLKDDIQTSQEFRLSVYLIPKLKNHARSSDLTVEFIKAEPGSEEEYEQYEKAIAFIKGGAESPYQLRPTQVVKKVDEKLGRPFTIGLHTMAWKKYAARPQKNTPGFKNNYCGWVPGHEGYLYSNDWVRFLLNELRVEQNYNDLRSYRA